MARHLAVSRGSRARRGPWLAAGLAAVAAAISMSMTAPAAAQDYKTLTPRLADKDAKQLEGKVQSTLHQAAAPSDAAKKEIDDYFMGYFFPKMTSTDVDQLGTLAESRKQLFARYINGAKSPAGRDQVVALTLKAVSAISAQPYHPAVRYNATLILGQLDQTPAAGGAKPKPLPAATTALLERLEAADIQGVVVPSLVKMAALVGLERHTRMDLDPQLAARVTAAALAIAARTQVPEDISKDVNNWMRTQAAHVLANQFATGITPPVHKALVDLIGNKDLSLDDRCKVAKMLAPTMYQGAQGVNADDMAAAIGKLAKAVLAEERKNALDYQTKMTESPGGFAGGGFEGGFRGGGGRGGYDGGGRGGFGAGMPEMPDTGPHYERRRFLDRVMAVHFAGEAVATTGSDELKKRLADLLTPLKRAADKAIDKKTNEVTLSREVLELADTVNEVVDSWTADAAPAAAEADATDIQGDLAAGG